MLGVKSLDYNNYYVAFKGNYRKGVHRFRSILENPTVAQEFAMNVGGVSVILGWPIGHDDKNSAELLGLLQGSSVIDTAVLTWLSQWYEDYTTDADTVYSDLTRCQEMAASDLMWRAVGSSPVGVGKAVATLAGLSCEDYADITAVAASSTAMAAVISSPTALSAVVASSTAMAAVAASSTAMTAVTASPTAMTAICASSMAVAKYAASAAGLDPGDYDNMTELAASSTAMAAVAASSTAMTAVAASSTAMAAVAASSTAMAAVAGSPVAMVAIWQSSTAIDAVEDNPAAWEIFTGASSEVMGKTAAILAGLDPIDYADMTAVAASSTAMAAVAASTTAMTAVSSSDTALTALFDSPLAVTTAASTWGTPAAGGTLVSGKRILVGFSQKQYSSGPHSSTLGSKTGGSGSGDFTITFEAANYNTYQKMAIVVNPLLWRSNTWGGNFSSTYINGVKTIPVS